MAAQPRMFVFDSWAIIAYFEDEPAGQKIEEIIIDANEREIPMWISVVNAGEVWYIVARQTSPSEADSTIAELRSLGIHFENPDWKATRQAAAFKSKHKMSYADAFAAALSMQKNAHLVTGDNEFKQVEKEIKILWV
jgi:uncharacterized protein